MLLALLVACGAPSEAPVPVADPWPTAELHGAWRSVPSVETQGELPGNKDWRNVQVDGLVQVYETGVRVTGRLATSGKQREREGRWVVEGEHARLTAPDGVVSAELERVVGGVALLHLGPQVEASDPPIALFRCTADLTEDPDCLHSRRKLAVQRDTARQALLARCSEMPVTVERVEAADVPPTPSASTVMAPDALIAVIDSPSAGVVGRDLRVTALTMASRAQGHDLQATMNARAATLEDTDEAEVARWWVWRGRALEGVRRAVSDPVRLGAVWAGLRPAVTAALARQPDADRPAKLAEVLRHFEGIEDAVTELHAQEARLDHVRVNARGSGCEMLLWQRQRELRAKITDAGYDPYLVGFVQRRRAEGGQSLVDAWAAVVRDLLAATEAAGG